MLEITGPTPHVKDIKKVLNGMQRAGMALSSPLMRRLLEAMSDETALELLPLMLSLCAHMGPVRFEQAPLSLLVFTLEKAVRISGKDALRALVYDQASHRGGNMFSRSEIFIPKRDADTLTALLMRLVYGTELVVHPACPDLGSWHLCNFVLYTQASQLEPYARPYRAMIENAIVHGALRLDQIEEIRSHRDAIRGALPRIRWDMVFNPGVDAPKIRVHAGVPALGSEYVVSLISPNDASNLILGHKESYLGRSRQLDHPEMMLERLAGGWMVWSIANGAGDTAAVAWATFNEEQDLVIDCVDVGVNFRKPQLGNELVDALLAFGPKVAAAIGARRVFVPPPKWALETFNLFDSFKRPTHPQNFVSGVPPFMGRKPYTESLNQGSKNYFIIDPT